MVLFKNRKNRQLVIRLQKPINYKCRKLDLKNVVELRKLFFNIWIHLLGSIIKKGENWLNYRIFLAYLNLTAWKLF